MPSSEGLSGAGVEILNRGLGLPAAQVDVDVPVRRQISTMSIGELRALEEKLTALPPRAAAAPGAGLPLKRQHLVTWPARIKKMLDKYEEILKLQDDEAAN